MIKTLRRKFIAIAMCSIALVLAALITGINIANYVNVCRTADQRISFISENGGTLPDSRNKVWPLRPDTSLQNPEAVIRDYRNPGSENHALSAEAAFDTRYFTVTIDRTGTVLSVNTGKIATISTADASKYASSLWRRHKDHGFIDDYRYRTVAATSGSGHPATMYIFLYAERELNAFHNFLLSSIGISILGFILVFLLVILFSKKALDPVAESYKKQKQFITNASHEIKTPLAIIAANTEVMEMNNGENQWTTSTRNQVARLTALTEKLVFLSRMDEETTHVDMREFPLSDAVCDTAAPFGVLAASRGVTLSLDVQPNITIKGDETSIRQLVSLLLDNAVKYSTDESDIHLSLRLNGKAKIKLLTVRNVTESIAPGRHDELFERFYRADTSRNSKTGGFGIGLSAAKAIVNAHKGKITAKSEDGKSLIFTVMLP